MHYTKRYNDPDPKINHDKAIQDIKDYLGLIKFKKICKIVHGDQTMSRDMFIMSLSIFIGIEGFPAEAFADELGLVKTSTETRTDLANSACTSLPEG